MSALAALKLVSILLGFMEIEARQSSGSMDITPRDIIYMVKKKDNEKCFLAAERKDTFMFVCLFFLPVKFSAWQG